MEFKFTNSPINFDAQHLYLTLMQLIQLIWNELELLELMHNCLIQFARRELQWNTCPLINNVENSKYFIYVIDITYFEMIFQKFYKCSSVLIIS